MAFLKDDTSTRLLRAIRTVFFLITMIISFLLFSAPILVAIADTLLPSALLSASISSVDPTNDLSDNKSLFFFFQTISTQLTGYSFRYSLIDIPLVSILRSGIILCVYGLCDGPGLSTGPYLGITTASYVFGGEGAVVGPTELALFVCSPVLAIGHIVVAYRISCRERRKLLVYKIDIEAVSTFKNGFRRYSKMLHDARVKVLKRRFATW
ncbi:hypothetical protein M8C21_025578 [Ambrosia artemisiifolia]|uniref:Uncharacterized protein n=1 Tax=Ambrosia artemisiifolia TaxID=4212 RepID=A0AAD5CIB3_AMBAR|nr:hypothetical protein M8C21_025578 [Ambrosia artemisiifolia]